uniref:UEV domain-containing protein n=1 Tax=Trichuris muris TaxID=70415 RepID=A0A5S6R461_TRIMR
MQDREIESILVSIGSNSIAPTIRDVKNALRQFPDLVPSRGHHVLANGCRTAALMLSGTIPIHFKENTYNIPICVYLFDTYPRSAPICFVRPTARMVIKPSMHVDNTGLVYLPYLTDWNRDADSDLVGLLSVMSLVFGDNCPVFTKTIQPVAAAPAKQMPRPTYVYPGMHPPLYGQPVSTGRSLYPVSGQTGQEKVPYGNYPPYPTGGSVYAPPYPSNFRPLRPAARPQYGGTIQPEHIRVSLISAAEDVLRKKLIETVGQLSAELDSLKRTNEELVEGATKLDIMSQEMEEEETKLKSASSAYDERISRIEKALLSVPNEEVPVDDIVDTTAPLYRQIVDCYVEDCAIDDTLYYLSEALKKNLIGIDVYLKMIRNLSRRQFMLRATMQKCRKALSLRDMKHLSYYSEQDASDVSVAIVELDAGLNSPNVVDQVKAISKVNACLNKHNFPFLVNALFIRLVEAFRRGSNFVRRHVIQAFQCSMEHIGKIFDPDQIGKPLLAVYYSNDVDARAQTLRLVGLLAPVLSDSKQVQMFVRDALRSHDQLELREAILAAKRFCKYSRYFANIIVSQVSEMLESFSFPMEIKIMLVPILQYMQTTNIGGTAMITFCRSRLMLNAGNVVFANTLLRTLTKLCLANPTLRADYRELLFSLLDEDYNIRLKVCAARCFHSFVQKCPRGFGEKELNKLSSVCLSSALPELKRELLKALSCATNHPQLKTWTFDEGTPIVLLSRSTVCTESFADYVCCLRILCNLIQFSKNSDLQMSLSEAFSDWAFHSLSLWDVSAIDKSCSLDNFQSFVSCVIQYCLLDVAQNVPVLTHFLISLIVPSGAYSPELLKSLRFLCDRSPEMLRLCCSKIDSRYLNVVPFHQTFFYFLMPPSCTATLTFDHVLELADNCWQLYQFGSHALCVGYFKLAKDVFQYLSSAKLSSSLSWLRGLFLISEAEEAISSLFLNSSCGSLPLRACLRNAQEAYSEAICLLQALNQKHGSLWFALEWCRIRKRSLAVMADIALIVAQSGWCHSVQVLRLSVQLSALSKLSKDLHYLKESCFDCDPKSLQCIGAFQSMVCLLKSALETATAVHSNAKASLRMAKIQCPYPWMIDFLSDLNEKVDNLEERTQLTSENASSEVMLFLSTLRWPPFPVPISFFHTCQQTTVKLKVTPESHSSSDAISLNSGQRLVIKIEGVVKTRSSRKRPLRESKFVQLKLQTSTEESDGAFGSVKAAPAQDQMPTSLTKEICIETGYFTTSFVIDAQKTTGSATISTRLLDKSKMTKWRVGEPTKVFFKVPERAEVPVPISIDKRRGSGGLKRPLHQQTSRSSL